MNILVTGADGYIGSVLAPYLIQRGHSVTGLDTGFYRDLCFYKDGCPELPTVINKDIRHVAVDELRSFEAVVHLAELSNDPLGQFNPAVTYEINHHGTVELAKKCKAAEVPRFLYTSSCSVYGVGSGEYKTEESETNPQTAYAKCKVLSENDLARLADDAFSPIFLRNATAFGPSPRMRFDLVLNNLAGFAWTTGEIRMTSDGSPWRPLVHVLDICEAIACCLEAPRDAVHAQIMNVGNNDQNYQVKDVAEIVASVFRGCNLTVGKNNGDNRSYRVCFDKIHKVLPGFRCKKDAVSGASELRELFGRINLSREIFEFRAFTRLKQLEHLIAKKQINGQFFWIQA